MSQQKLAFTIEQATEASGVGRTALFAAVRTGRLRARKLGRRTLILAADLQSFLDGLPLASPDDAEETEDDVS